MKFGKSFRPQKLSRKLRENKWAKFALPAAAIAISAAGLAGICIVRFRRQTQKKPPELPPDGTDPLKKEQAAVTDCGIDRDGSDGSCCGESGEGGGAV